KREYERDVAAGAEIQIPKNYFPDDDPSQQPGNQWRAYAHLLFWNWIYEIYEHMPFDISTIGESGEEALEQTGA
ncbi:MAG: homoserine O-succinyltransferase, partial [Gemmatimonadales bacterium]